MKENKCKKCSCLKCVVNENKNKTCLSTREFLEITDGCLGCSICETNEHCENNNIKACVKVKLVTT